MSTRLVIALAVVVAVGGAIVLFRATRGARSVHSVGAADRTAAGAGEPDGSGSGPSPSSDRPRPALPDDLGVAEATDAPRIFTTGPTPEGEEMPLEDRAAAMRRLGSAREAYKAEDYLRALAIAESVLQVMPTRGSAREIAAIAACRAGQAERAQSHADHLARHLFKRARNVCLDADIALIDPYASDPIDAGFER